MKKVSSDEVLQNQLRKGEQVLWKSGTKPFALLAKDASTQILSKWIGTCVVIPVILALYIRSGNVSWKMAGVLVLIGLALIVSPILEQRNLMRQMYYITDRRAILITANQTVYTKELAELDDFQLLRSPGGADCLVLGSEIYEDLKWQLRWRACHPKTPSQSSGQDATANGMIFYNVENAEAAAALLSKQMSRAAV